MLLSVSMVTAASCSRWQPPSSLLIWRTLPQLQVWLHASHDEEHLRQGWVLGGEKAAEPGSTWKHQMSQGIKNGVFIWYCARFAVDSVRHLEQVVLHRLPAWYVFLSNPNGRWVSGPRGSLGAAAIMSWVMTRITPLRQRRRDDYSTNLYVFCATKTVI